MDFALLSVLCCCNTFHHVEFKEHNYYGLNTLVMYN